MADEIDYVVEVAEAHCETLLKQSAAISRTARRIAAKADCVVVSRRRYEALERLYESVRDAAQTARMTRDYKDVLELYGEGGRLAGKTGEPEHYNGKRFLVRRSAGGAVMEALGAVRRAKRGGTDA